MKKTLLLTCGRLVDLAGSEVTTLELAEAFKNMGWRVSVAAFEISAEIERQLDGLIERYFDLSDAAAFVEAVSFDLAWLHHSTTSYRVLLDESVHIDQIVFSSLSFFEPTEAPPVSEIVLSGYLVNSQENFSYFSDKYPELCSRTFILHNSAPRGFWVNYQDKGKVTLKRLAIISNHMPEEVYKAVPALVNNGVVVDVIGLAGDCQRVTPELLSRYDAVITIGKTVQYCLASCIPVYCYDHFGGDGWLNEDIFDCNRVHNFSGRGSRGRVSAEKIVHELMSGFESAASKVEPLQKISRQYFSFEKNISDVLEFLVVAVSRVSLSETDRNILARQNLSYAAHRGMISNLQRIVSDRELEVASLVSDVEVKSLEISSLNAQVKSAGLEIAALSAEVRRADLEINSLNAEVKSADLEISELRRGLHALEQELFGMKNSRSWKMTWIFRVIWKNLGAQLNKINVRIAWMKVLSVKSLNVIRTHGVVELFRRVISYVKAWRDRRVAARNIALISSGYEAFSNNDLPLVSFVIPVYDRTDVLRLAIQSALEQTIDSLEVIIVTDGSPQETLAVINDCAKDPRVRVFNFPQSSGNAVRGRNKGIIEARGQYIAFLDSDDIASPDRLERSLPLLEQDQADVVYGAWQALVDGSRSIPGIIDGQVSYSPDADLEMLLDICVPCQSTVMVRRSLFDRSGLLKPSMRYREDHELWARLAFYGARFRSVPNVMTRLRLHSGNNELNFKDSDGYWLDRLHAEYEIAGPKPKKIAFILPGVGISGGIAVVFKHAALLMRAGHDAFVINVGYPGDGGWFTDNPVPIVNISDPRRYLFDGIDLLVATGWSTVEWLEGFQAKRKLYFVQSDERRFFDEPAIKEKINETYKTSCEYFTEAHWIRRFLKDEFGHDAAYVPNGLDVEVFYPDEPLLPKPSGKLRVLLEGPIVIPFKGMADSYAAVKDLDCEIWIVSSAGKPPEDWRCDRFFEGVPFGEMRKIYSACDIFLKMSRIEGFFGPPMEAMACGCAVVVGKVTGYDEYIVHEENALVVEQGDISGAGAAVQRLITDGDLRGGLVKGGLKTASEWGWDNSLDAMLSVVMSP